jgi:uncharacterized protein (DUF427 family)
VEPTTSRVRVEHADAVIAETTRAVRVLETSQPPAFYIPRSDIRLDLLTPSTTTTFCEWKGSASYWSLAEVPDVAWCYGRPTAGFEAIAGHLAFYAQKVDGCFVDGERVIANEGTFYGGWITSKVVGPFKGAAGTAGW